MRYVVTALGFVFLLVATSRPATAQFGAPGTPVGTPVSLGNAGAPSASPVGAPVGGQVGSGIGGLNPSNSQDFSNIDRNRLAAPLPDYTGIGAAPTLWDRTKQRMIGMVNFLNPFDSDPPARRPTWVPGISRRNRERAEERRWQRD